MFCSNCGKEISNTVNFCNFCGSPVRDTMVQPLNEPVHIPEPPSELSGEVMPAAAFEISENVLENAVSSENTSELFGESSVLSESVGEAPVPAPEYPTPGTIPTLGASSPIPPSYPKITEPDSEKPEKTEKAAEPAVLPVEKPERKYSLRHIVMCLAAAGVMAIAAGVFAGLYFSVI